MDSDDATFDEAYDHHCTRSNYHDNERQTNKLLCQSPVYSVDRLQCFEHTCARVHRKQNYAKEKRRLTAAKISILPKVRLTVDGHAKHCYSTQFSHQIAINTSVHAVAVVTSSLIRAFDHKRRPWEKNDLSAGDLRQGNHKCIFLSVPDTRRRAIHPESAKIALKGRLVQAHGS